MADDRFSEEPEETTPGERVYRGPKGPAPTLGPAYEAGDPKPRPGEPDWEAMRRSGKRPSAEEIAAFNEWFAKTFGCEPDAKPTEEP